MSLDQALVFPTTPFIVLSAGTVAAQTIELQGRARSRVKLMYEDLKLKEEEESKVCSKNYLYNVIT